MEIIDYGSSTWNNIFLTLHLICRKWDRLRGQSYDYLSASRSLPSITEVWPSVVYFEYCWFLPYRTEPSVKKIEVVDCDFIAVPLIWLFCFLVLFLNHCRIYCTFGWICHNLPRLWKIHTMIKPKMGVKVTMASQ